MPTEMNELKNKRSLTAKHFDKENGTTEGSLYFTYTA